MPPCLPSVHARHVLIALGVVLLMVLCLPPAGARAAGADVRFGTWSPNEPYWGSIAGVESLQARSGRDVEIVNWYQNWGGGSWISSVQPHLVSTVTNSGRTPLLTWEPWDPALGVDQPAFALAQIADGAHDSYIASFARGLRDLGSDVNLRPMHEMNGTWYPWSGGVNGNTTAQYVKAWRRMHDIFAAQGATNVRWVWSPNNIDMSPAQPMEAFYPGAAYVDVLAVDGYNWGSTAPEFGGWRTFTEVFQNAYDRLKALGPQPIWIAEVGTAPEGGDKATWIRDMFSRAEEMDRLEAIVWFNENKERDWRADPSDAVAAAFSPLLAALPAALPAPQSAPPAAATPAPKPTPQPAPPPAPTPAPAPTGSAAAHDAPGFAPTTTTADRTRPRRSRARLRLQAARRLRAGARPLLRWRTTGTRSAGSRNRITRWVVLLDGRRIRTIKATGRRPVQRLRHRVSRRGTHRWRVEGRAAGGRRVLSATLTFRVTRAG